MRHAHNPLDFTSNWIETLNVPSCNQCARGSCTIFRCWFDWMPTDNATGLHILYDRHIKCDFRNSHFTNVVESFRKIFGNNAAQMQFRKRAGVTSQKRPHHTCLSIWLSVDFVIPFTRRRHSVSSMSVLRSGEKSDARHATRKHHPLSCRMWSRMSDGVWCVCLSHKTALGFIHHSIVSFWSYHKFVNLVR